MDLPRPATATSRRRASTPPGASSTSTTSAGAQRRDHEKFDEMIDFARALPLHAASASSAGCARDGMTRERVLACAVRLLDRGFFRVGGEEYAAENESYGLATMQARHVTLERRRLDHLRLPGQERQAPRSRRSSIPRSTRSCSASSAAAAEATSCSPTASGRRWRDIRSADINEYVKEVTGGDFSAKDFRTWNATVLAAVALAVSGQASGTKTARKRARDARGQGGGRATSATRRRSAARRTSTRACSTASATDSRSAACSRTLGRAAAGTDRGGGARPARRGRQLTGGGEGGVASLVARQQQVAVADGARHFHELAVVRARVRAQQLERRRARRSRVAPSGCPSRARSPRGGRARRRAGRPPR